MARLTSCVCIPTLEKEAGSQMDAVCCSARRCQTTEGHATEWRDNAISFALVESRGHGMQEG